MKFENRETTNQLNDFGLRYGDIVRVKPLAGKEFEFEVNRTRFDFACDKYINDLNVPVKKKINTLKNEEFHIKLHHVETKSVSNEHLKRYFLEVIEGGAVRHNGNLTRGVFVQQGDVCEIGYNIVEFLAGGEEAKESNKLDSVLANKKLIQSQLSILLQGETGTGKTRAAKMIHESSKQRGRFVHINISAFSQGLIESELFGHKKGAFTGAVSDKLGAFKEADHGTLFIDEIDSLPLELQTKLLLFFDDYTARAVGSDRNYKVRTRLIFASGRKLKPLVEAGLMREDFYFRLISGDVLNMKSLRDSPKKIEEFCESFARENSVKFDSNLVSFYKTLPWPGNFRQLKGHLNRKLVVSNSSVMTFDGSDERLIEESSALEEIFYKSASLAEIKVAYAKKVYFRSHENIAVAAKRLNISPKSLRSMVSA